jgi:hypothetical protein
MSSKKHRIDWLVSIDDDDPTMKQKDITDYCVSKGITLHSSPGTGSKIEACNRDMDKAKADWDILLLISDDMECTRGHWDDYISTLLDPSKPTLLWAPDGLQGRICTLPIVTKAWYGIHNYIYHPDYLSLWADNEMTEVAEARGYMNRISAPLFSHRWVGKFHNDQLHRRNESLYNMDRDTYNRRKAAGFP